MSEPMFSSRIATKTTWKALRPSSVPNAICRARAQGIIDAMRHLSESVGEGQPWQEVAWQLTRINLKRIAEMDREEGSCVVDVLDGDGQSRLVRVRDGESEYYVSPWLLRPVEDPLSLLRERRGDANG